MADETVNESPHPGPDAGPSATASRAYQYRAFQWRDPGVDDALYQGFAIAPFIERAQDTALGVRTVLELLEWDALEQALDGEARRPMLPPATVGNLRRLAITSLAMLGADAERMLEWMSDTKERLHMGGAADGVRSG